MDELFTKEKVLCNVSLREDPHRIFLESAERIQSRKVANAVLERIEEDKLEVSEIFIFMGEFIRIAKKLTRYGFVQLKRKFDGIRLINYIIGKPLQFTHKEESLLREFIDILDLKIKSEKEPVFSPEIVQVSVLFYLAKRSKVVALEIRYSLLLIEIIKKRKSHRTQEYLEEIVGMVKRQIENRGYVEKVKELVKNDWPYEKTNPAQKALLGLLKEESCPYENFSTRQIPIHMIDPLFIRDKQTIHLLPVIFCIERLLEENPDVSSVLVSEYIDCVSPYCKERINSEHIRYYLLHRMRIDAEVDKLIGETLVHSLMAKNILPKGILHLKKYQTHKYLNYVVISLKRIEKKQTESKEEKELLFSVLHCFSMYGANEEYVISQAKAACKESSVQKILLVLNILYKVHGTKKIGFAIALLSHALLKRETSFYTKTIVRAVGKKHKKNLEIAKPLILDHFIYRATDDLKTDAFGTLSYLYGYASVKEFLEMEKYYLAPRLWQTERVDEYYTDLPTIFIYYAIYIHETKKGGGLGAELIEQLKNTMNNIGVEVAVTIFLAIPEPAGFFKECGIDIKDLLFGHSLISILCATRKILEEKIIPINNCVFNLIHTALSYTCQQDGKYYIQEVQEIILFLIYTGNIKGKESCCDMHCSKTQFFNQLIEKSEKHDIIQNRYMIAQDLSKEQKKMIEQLVGEDPSLYFEEASTFKEAVIRIHPYLKLRASLEFLSIKKILPLILKASHTEIHSFAQSHWAQCRRLIISLYRMYSDSKDKEALQALACFGIFGIDALEERNDISDVFLDKTVRCVNFDYEERKDYMAEFLISKIFVPIYYETHDDLLQYIIQELLKDIKTNNFTEFTDLLGKLRTSQYIIEMDAGRLQEIKSERHCAPYRRGISHAQFLINVITALAQIPIKKYQFHILHDTLAILDTLSGKKWPQRHKESLLQSYLFLMIFSLKSSHQESIREHFLPIFRDIKAGALVDLDILRCIISSAQYMNSIFTDEELLLCSRHVKDRHLTIRILEVQLQDCKNSTEKDALLTEIQKEYLKIEEKDVVFGINAEITKLSPVNLAAELKINNEHANYAYLNKEILQHRPTTSQMDAKYEELFKSISNEKTPTEIFQKAEQAIQKWACTAPSYSFDRDTSSLKSFLIDIHLLQDCQILQTVSLPKALQIIKDRRELPRTYQSLRVSEIHRNLFQLLPAVPEVARAEEDALLYGVRIARKSGQCELSEKLLIRSILKDDWRVFYEKAKIHLDKNNKSLAKQALQRLMDNLPINSKYKEKAILLNTEIENSEEIYKNALSSLKTNERLYFRYGKYLEKKQPVQAFKMFCMALECGSEKAPEIIPKLIHYITGTTNPLFTRDSIASCATEMMDTVHNVDIKIFRRCYIQILTRLSHKEKTVEALLQKISLRLIEEFPSEFAWRTLSLFNNKKNTAIHKLIEKTSFTFRKLFSDVMAFTQTLSKLSMHSAGSGMVSIPSILGGSIIVSRGIPAPFDDFLSEIISISDNMYVFATLQKPKKIETITSTGCYKSFLCKANDDLRKDAGFMDLNLLLNSLFQSDNKCRAFNIRVYTVVPITEKMGIIEFVENLVTLKDICTKLHSAMGINIKEIGAELGFTKKIVMLGRKNLEDLLKRVPPVLPTYFLRQFTHPVEWLQSRKRYTITYAVMNAVGYLMGLGDRHCENILFDSITGETVHVDLNCIFDKGHALTVPETVPFRLTQNIVAAFGPTKEEGQYKLTLERVLKFLSANRDLIVANLLGFVHDPLGEWTGRNNTKTAIQIIEKTKAKLDFDDEITKSSVLIESSTSLDSLSKMYVWWLPFI
ncbi:serine/threonine-protein kinase ATR [Nematocida sp. AWRm79]|nr:serine/threonine-protein kinase ATR [Nematocida sp. AWRm79]